MKTINIAELKSRLSYFLKLVKQGQTILVKDRSEPIAELIPLRNQTLSKKESLIREGKILPSTLQGSVKFCRIAAKIDVVKLLDEVRAD